MAKITNTFSKSEEKKIKEEKILIRDTIDRFEQQRFPKYLNNYKQYLGYTIDRLRDIEAWQTNISYPLAASIVDTMFSNLFDFNFVFWVQEDKLRDLLEQTFDYKSQWKEALKGSLKECLICWEWYTQPGLFLKKESYKILNRNIEVKTKKPSMEYLSIFNAFFDEVHGVDKSPYQITRIFNTGEYIKKKYAVLFEDGKTAHRNIMGYFNKILNATQANRERFSNYDYNPVKRINNFSNILVKSHNNGTPISTGIAYVEKEIDKIDKNNFYLVKDKKSYEIVEYMEAGQLTVYVDGMLLYRWTPLIDGELTSIQRIVFNEIPWAGVSNGQIDNLSHLQNMLTWIWNWFLDNMKMQLSGMFEIRGNVPGLNRDGKLRFERFKWIRMSQDASIKRLDLWLNDFSPINTAQFIEWITEKRAGVNGYLLWGQSKVERVSDSINLIHDQYKSKLTPVIDSVQIMMGNIAKSWILIYLKHFSEAELNKLWLEFEYDEENNDLKMNSISVADIIRDENISFKFNSLRNIEKEKKRGIIKEIYLQLIQVKQFDNNQVNELIKVLLDEDFDLDTFKGIELTEANTDIERSPLPEGWEEDLEGGEDNQSNEGWTADPLAFLQQQGF